MKLCLVIMMMITSSWALAESNCDVQLGSSVGQQVVEFSTGHVIHSKMSLSESTPDAILEEMINLQDMGVCTEKIFSKKCVLKIEKKAAGSIITLIRGEDRWHSWDIKAKTNAQLFVKNLKRVGFCS